MINLLTKIQLKDVTTLCMGFGDGHLATWLPGIRKASLLKH